MADIKTALIVPQSGEYKIWGDELAEGVRIAIDEINEQGGLKGQKVVLNVIDDPCSENLAISTAQMLTLNNESKPSLVIGPYCSDGFEKIAGIYAQAKIFQIVPMILTKQNASQNYKGLIRIAGVKEQIGTDFFKFYNQRLAGHRTALIFDNTQDDIVKSASSVIESFRRHGKNSMIEAYAFEQDMEPLVNKITDSQQDVIILLGKPKKIAKTIRQLKKLNKNAVIITDKYMVGDSLNEYAKDYLDNVYFMGLPSVETTADYAELMVNLRLKGINMDGLNIYGYTAVKIWSEMVKKTKSIKYKDLSEAAKSNDTQKFWTNAKPNSENNDNKLHYVFYQYLNGEFVQFD